jgi:hypothetical protein
MDKPWVNLNFINMKIHKNKILKKDLSLTFKQGTRQGYVIQKQEHNICKTNIKLNLYYANIYKHEHEKNITKLRCKIVLKIGVQQTKKNERSYLIYTLFWWQNQALCNPLSSTQYGLY